MKRFYSSLAGFGEYPFETSLDKAAFDTKDYSSIKEVFYALTVLILALSIIFFLLIMLFFVSVTFYRGVTAQDLINLLGYNITFSVFVATVISLIIILPTLLPGRIGLFFKKCSLRLMSNKKFKNKAVYTFFYHKKLILENKDISEYKVVLEGDFARYLKKLSSQRSKIDSLRWDFIFEFKKIPNRGLLIAEW